MFRKGRALKIQQKINNRSIKNQCWNGVENGYKIAPKMNSDKIVVMNMCGRGDKDIFTVAENLNIKI